VGDTETYSLQASTVLRRTPDGQRRGRTSDWAALNPILADGEIGYATDTTVLKVGDGSSRWSDLAEHGSGGFTFTGTYAGGPDQSDTTPRLTTKSYQANGDHFYGETIRLDEMDPLAKNSIGWRWLRPADSADKLIMGPSNIGFETDTSGWSSVGSSTIARSTSLYVSGTASCLITWAAAGAGTQGMSASVTGLKIGNTYTARAWVWKSLPASVSVYLDVVGIGSGSASTLAGSWEQITYTFAATATSHTLRLLNATAANAGQNTYVDLVSVVPAFAADLKTTAWITAHYWSQSGGSLHGHLSFEAPNALDQLQTRFEIPFCDAAGNIGADKVNIKTNSADLTVRCVGTDSVGATQQQVLRLGAGAGNDRILEWSNDAETGAAGSVRWRAYADATSESGSNAGSDFRLRRYLDDGTVGGTVLFVKRSTGNIGFGQGSAAARLDVANAAAQHGVQVVSTVSLGGNSSFASEGAAASVATDRALATKATGDSSNRFVAYNTGLLEWGSGAASRDTSLERTAASVLATGADDVLKTGHAVTGSRPSASTVGKGAQFYDDTLSRPIWSDGTIWRDAVGVAA
jgi:hypothetical protein